VRQETSSCLTRGGSEAVFITTPEGRCPALEAHGIYADEHALTLVSEAAGRRGAGAGGCPRAQRMLNAGDAGPLLREGWDTLPSFQVEASQLLRQ